MRRSTIRPLISLVAAYVIALQAVLAGMTLAMRSGEAATLQFVLCAAAPLQPGQAPADTMPCCVSAACCLSASDPGALPVTLPLPVLQERTDRIVWLPVTESLRACVSGPQQPRAPPAA